jgi:hypothetical protein
VEVDVMLVDFHSLEDLMLMKLPKVEGVDHSCLDWMDGLGKNNI